MKLRKLPPDVVSKLRSGVAVVSIAHCTEELILNALDAGATAVAVRLNLHYHKVQVVDNGHGMSKEQLTACGERYSTSKCRSVADLEHPKFYGYRGEALASLAEMSGGLQIESRTAASETTYFKIFARGKVHKLTRSSENRPSVGTTVTVTDFMYNLPVRRRCVSETIDLEFCLQIIEGIALCHPNASFTLRNDITGEVCFQTHKTNSTLETFALLFGRSKAAALKCATHCEGTLSIKAYLSTEGHSSKQLQFIYLNDRLLLKTRVHKMINNVLKKYVFRGKSGFPTSPTKMKNKHPIFVVFLKCTSRTYDITFEPKKTMVEFANWDAVTKSLECLLGSFLRENQIISHDIVISGDLVYSQKTPEKPEHNPSLGMVASQLRVEDFRHALVSKRVSKLRQSDIAEDNVEKEAVVCQHHDEAPILPAQHSMAEVDEDKIMQTTEKGHSTEASAEQCKNLKLPMVSIALPPSYSDSSKNRGRLSLPKDKRVLDITKYSFQRKKPTAAKKPKGKEKCANVLQHVSPQKEICTHTSIKSRQAQSLERGTSERMDDVPEHLQEESTAFFQELAKDQCYKTIALKESSLIAQHGCSKATEKRVTFAEPSPYFGPGTNTWYFPHTRTSKHPQETSTLPYRQSKEHEHQQSTAEATPISKKLRRRFGQCTENANLKESTETHHSAYFLYDKSNIDNRSPRYGNGIIANDPSIHNAEDILYDHGESRYEYGHCDRDCDFEGVPNKVLRLNNPTFGDPSIETVEGLSQDDDESVCYEVRSVTNSYAINRNDSQCSFTTQPFTVTQEFQMPFFRYHEAALDPVKTQPPPSFKTETNRTSTRDTEIQKETSLNSLLEEETSSPLRNSLLSVSRPAISDVEYRANSCDEGSSSVIQCGQETNASLVSARSSSLPLTTLTFLRSKDNLSPTRNVQPTCLSQPNYDSSSDRHHFHSHISQQYSSERTTRNSVESISFINSQCNSKGKYFQEADLSAKAKSVLPECNVAHLSRHSVSSNMTKDPLKDIIGDDTQLPSFINDGTAVHQGTVNGITSSSEDRRGLPGVIQAMQITAPEVKGSASTTEEQNVEASEVEPENCEISPGWVAWEDPVSGQKMYINLPSGNSSFLPPPCLGEEKEPIKSPSLDLELRTNYVPCGDSKSLLSRPRVERPQFRCEPGQEQSSLVQLVQKWQNPVFTHNVLQDIPEAGLYRQKDSVTASFSIRQPYKFTKEMLEHIKVIGQVDAKFIACLMPVHDSGMFKDDCLVVLFDQHAAHERVRLEQLLEGQHESFGSIKRIRSSSVKPSLELSVEPDVLRRAVICQKELKQVGIQFTVKKSTVLVERLPTCLVERDNSERQNGRSPTLAKHAKEVLEEYTATLVSTKKTAITLPKVMHDVLSSQACRGAIKFGSVLGLLECQKILRGLATCSLPFQCAHGRPSVAPVVDLRYLTDKEVQQKPNLSKLHKAVSSKRVLSSQT
ncbi:DNA mismatch repair protein Mlh3-like isoform X2 [Ornithodoros turicata]|uniref:DNA mismatch repair protein Mlh3-like isoform X2 n=1 Tax=Ornithodoros turicata TaxID=34597 RepID=UPI003138D3F1